MAPGVLPGGGHQHRHEPLLRGIRKRQGAAVVAVAPSKQHQLTCAVPDAPGRPLAGGITSVISIGPHTR